MQVRPRCVFALQAKYVETREELLKELSLIPNKINEQITLIENCKFDELYYSENRTELDKEERKNVSNFIFESVMANEMQHEEREICTYNGFRVVLPANMLKEKPYLLLKNEGTYYVEIGNASLGALLRIDNCLEGLFERHIRLEEELEQLEAKRVNLLNDISKEENYAEQIDETKRRLEALDKELGVIIYNGKDYIKKGSTSCV